MPKNYQLSIIEAALQRKSELTEEQTLLLEWTRESFLSPLLKEGIKALACGENEVGVALLKAFADKYPCPSARVSDCVIYCRVSSEGQTKGYGLQRQLQTCMDYAKSMHYRVVAIFSEVWTGTEPLHVRGQAERMAKARKCKIVCEDYDRWSRRGAEDLPPANVEMASPAVKEFEEEIRKAFSPAQLHIIQGGLV